MEAKKWIGVDIHKKQMTVCIILERGKKEVKQYDWSGINYLDLGFSEESRKKGERHIDFKYY